jgi:hypothetical protein
MGYQCGQVWGAALAAGAQAFRLFGPGPQAESAALLAAQRLAESFEGSYRSLDCYEVTELNWKKAPPRELAGYVLKGGPVRCFTMSASFAQATRQVIDAALKDGVAPEAHRQGRSQGFQVESPASCASALARRRGALELHATMASGLAGGIGLSGAGCGALGAAIWLIAIEEPELVQKFDLDTPRVMQVVESFLEASGGEFTCEAIVGRRFAGLEEHATYLREGGCTRLMDTLAAA